MKIESIILYNALNACHLWNPKVALMKFPLAQISHRHLILFLFQGLKSHAVTMFEVGKLTDESLDSFLTELEKVSTSRDDSEGEAKRYFDHALVLRSTIMSLRNQPDFFNCGIDLIRCERLQSLEKSTCDRLLKKNYS